MYHLQVLTPEEIVFDQEIVSLIAPGESGYLGVLSNHAPLISLLKEGHLIITDAHQQKHYYQIEGGFLEVSHNQASILIESIKSTGPVQMGGAV